MYCYIGVVMVLLCIFIVWRFNRPCEEWERPSNVPVEAAWIGGCDGGIWLEFVDIQTPDTIRFKIYRDWNGDLILDANFVCDSCPDMQITENNWRESFSHFDGETLCVLNQYQPNGQYCKFVPARPFYREGIINGN